MSSPKAGLWVSPQGPRRRGWHPWAGLVTSHGQKTLRGSKGHLCHAKAATGEHPRVITAGVHTAVCVPGGPRALPRRTVVGCGGRAEADSLFLAPCGGLETRQGQSPGSRRGNAVCVCGGASWSHQRPRVRCLSTAELLSGPWLL